MSKIFEYYRPKTRAEAIELLANPNFHAAPLIVHPKPITLQQMNVDALIDLSLIGLDYIQETQDGILKIGALTTLQEMVESPSLMIRERNLLNKASWLVTSPGIRNLSGMWGAIQADGGPAEVVIALLALEAHVLILDAAENERTIAFQEFSANRKNSLLKGELILEVQLPSLRKNCGWALERVARTPRDEAIVAAAAIVEATNGIASQVNLALAGASPQPQRLLPVENLMKGREFTDQSLLDTQDIIRQQINPIGDFRGGVEYRSAMTDLVVRRALKKAWERATSLGN